MISTRVGICTLIEDRSPLGPVLPRWAEVDFGADDVTVFAWVNDASEATRQRVIDALPWSVVMLETPDLAELVPNLERAAGLYDSGTEIVRSHKRAAGRAAVQRQAVKAECDFLLWLDSDNTIPSDGYLNLRESLAATQGPLAPVIMAGFYPERRTGVLLPAQWGHRGMDECYVPLRPGGLCTAGFVGFGAVLMPHEIASLPALDFMERYTIWRNRWRTHMELDWHDPKQTRGVMGEDVLWFRACEVLHGVPCGVDCRVTADHWRDAETAWVIEPNEAGDGFEVFCQHVDGRRWPRGDEGIPPVAKEERP